MVFLNFDSEVKTLKKKLIRKEMYEIEEVAFLMYWLVSLFYSITQI